MQTDAQLSIGKLQNCDYALSRCIDCAEFCLRCLDSKNFSSFVFGVFSLSLLTRKAKEHTQLLEVQTVADPTLQRLKYSQYLSRK